MSRDRSGGSTSPALDPGAGLTERHVRLPDGRRIRTVTAGDGPGPLVVFEAGMGAPAASWVHTQREISSRRRTLAYDRSGYGTSDVDVRDRTLERMAEDLAAVLDAVDEPGPVVLVGHSWGVPIIRLFADRWPGRVAGLVFVDGSLAEAMSAGRIRVAVLSLWLMSGLARAGGSGLIRRMTLAQETAAEISEADLAIMMRDYACVPAMAAARREAHQVMAGLPTLSRLQSAGPPDVPTVSLQGARVDPGMRTMRPLLNRIAARLMEAAPRGRITLVEGAGHLIPQERPAAVRDAILEVVDAAS